MIKAILAPYLGWIYAAVFAGALAGAIFIYNAVYERGYSAAAAYYALQAEKTKNANDLAIEKAAEALKGDLQTLVVEKEKLEDEISRLNEAAAKDLDAANCGIGPNSVRRVNSIR